jgi:hypothetical protein
MSGDLGEHWKKTARARDFRIRVVVHEGRDQAIDHGKDAVLRNQGAILDFKMFSNLSLAMIIELSGSRLLSLLDSLVELGWNVDVEPDREAIARRATDLLEGTLQMTFPEGDGELEIPVPAVPG